MNLTINELKEVYEGQKKYLDETGVKTMQFLMAEDLLELYERIEYLEDIEASYMKLTGQ